MRSPTKTKSSFARPFAGLVIAFLLPLAACDDGGTAAPVPTQIQVTPQSATLVGPGAQQQFAATVRDQSGQPISGASVSWSSTAPSIISVNSAGMATALAEGSAEIRASSGGVTGLASAVVVGSNDCVATVSLAPGESLVQDAVGANGCDLMLPSGSAGDRYRVGLVWPESDRNETTVADVTFSVTGVGGVTDDLPAELFAAASEASGPRTPIAAELVQGLLDAAADAEANSRAHLRLREMEREMLPRLVEATRASRSVLSLAAEGPPLLADSPARWVYDPAVDSSCDAGTPRVANFVAENEFLAIYQDSIQAASTPASATAVQQILDYYRDHGKEVVDDYFGGVPDINADGRLRVLIAPVVDTKRAVAFVWSGDMFPKTADGQDVCPQSNEMDLVYLSLTLVNRLTQTPPADRQDWQALGTMVHEAKHVSSLWNGVRGAVEGGIARGLHPSWIEEGTAEIAAEISSRIAWAAAGGPARNDRLNEQDFRDESPSVFNANNYGVVLRLARTVLYMSGRPNGIPNADAQAHFGTIYGSGWHFHRFLGDQYGGAGSTPGGDGGFFASQNSDTSTPGVPGIEALAGKPYELVFLEYAEAVIGHSVGLGTRPVDFRTYDFLATEILCSTDPGSAYNALGRYPWPLTVTGTRGDCDNPEEAEESKSFASASYAGKLGTSGIQFLDLISNGTGQGAEIAAGLSVSVPAKWVVVRID
jgi:hypothetical protein